MKDKLILKNNFIIELESGASLSEMKTLFADKDAMMEAWRELTIENLSEVTIRNGDGIVISRMAGLILVSETSIVQSDGKILTSFHLREKTYVEKCIERIDEILEIYDGAITDLGEAVDNIAEEGRLS